MNTRFAILALAVCLAVASSASAAEPLAPTEGAESESDAVSVDVPVGRPLAREGYADVIKIVILLSVLTLLPGIILTMTSFTRIVIVLSLVKRAIGLQQMPPNMIMVGVALFLTAFVMAPVWKEVQDEALVPASEQKITETEALKRASVPLRKFMIRHTRRKDLALFLRVAGEERPETADDVPFYSLVPAFALSEIKTAFLMGFVVFLPMIVLDMVVATILTSMGMFMLPPMMISMPLKILLFVLVDGWRLVIGSVVQSFSSAV